MEIAYILIVFESVIIFEVIASWKTSIINYEQVI